MAAKNFLRSKGKDWTEVRIDLDADARMKMVADTGRMGSLDLVEVNPALDKRNATARLAVDLVESLFGKSTLMRD